MRRKKVDEAVVDDIVVYIRHYFEDTGMLPNAREYEDLVQAAQQTARVVMHESGMYYERKK